MSTATPADIQAWMDDYDIRQIEEIAHEYGRVMEWFHKNYPTGDIRLDVNSDQRYGILKYKLTVITEKEATPHNQGLFTSEVVINKSKFMDIHWMSRFKRSLYDRYVDSISHCMNEHYKIEKEKHG